MDWWEIFATQLINKALICKMYKDLKKQLGGKHFNRKIQTMDINLTEP